MLSAARQPNEVRAVIQASAQPAPVELRTDVLFAGFWRRLLAYLIDQTVLFGVYLSIFAAVRLLSPDSFGSGPVVNSGQLDVAALTATIAALTNVSLVCGAIGLAYYAVLESSPARGTLGKLALGLYVADVFGDPISFWRAVARNLLKFFSNVTLGIGWLMAGFTPRKQALHDLLAGTLVLRRSNYFVIGREAPKEPGDHWDGKSWVASVPPLERM